MKKTVIKVLLVIAWMVVIFSFSNQKADNSTKLSNGLIRNTVCKISTKNCNETIDLAFKPVRKTAHFLEYLVLGLLVLNCFNINKKYMLYSLIICFLYSISDEVHQIFVPGRSCEVLDVMIDTIGSLIGIISCYRHK